MCEFEIPSLLYYTHIPAFIVSFLIALFVYISNKQSEKNKNISIVLFLCSLWILMSFSPWVFSHASINIFFVRASSLITFSLLFFLFFSAAFSKKKLSLRTKLLFSFPFIPVILLLFSDYNARLTNLANCTSEYGLMLWYYYAISVIYLTLSLKNLLVYYRSNKNEDVRKQIAIIVFSFAFLVVWFVFMSFLAKVFQDEEIYLFSPLGIVIFSASLAYAIAKYHFLKIRLLLAQFFTYSIWFILFAQLFFIEKRINLALTLGGLFLAILLGRFLIRSIKEEQRLIVQLKSLTQSLFNANSHLRMLDRAKSEFVSIASHQLRTPLTAVKGYTALLLDGDYGEFPERSKDVLQKIQTSNERLIHLVEDLLSISRIESGKMEYKIAAWDLADIVRDTVGLLAIKARQKGLSLDFRFSDGVSYEVDLDGEKIREVITNLIDNALKYTSKGFVHVSLEKNATGIRFEVRDSGIGVDPKDIPNLFEKFSRGRDTRRLAVGGTGLGLYVARNIVNAHGGRIWVESEGINKGATFIMELPFHSQSLPANVSQ